MLIMKKKGLSLLAAAVFSSITAFCQSPSNGIDNNLLMGYFQGQDYGDAVTYLKTKADALREDGKVLPLLGYAYFMNNQLHEAADIYRKILGADSLSLIANGYLARISFLQKNYPSAVSYYDKLVTLKPQNAYYAKQLAGAYYHLQKNDSALKYYGQSYLANPDDPEVVVSLCGLLEGKKDFAVADSMMDGYLAKDSTQMDVISARVNAAFLQDKFQDIFPFAQRLMGAQDIAGVAMPLTLLAMSYYYTGHFDSCLKACDFMIMNKIKTETVMYLEGMALKKLKKYTASIAAFNECIGMAISKSADTYFTEKGEDYELLKQYHSAIAQYDSAHYIFHDPMRLYNIGRVYDAGLKNPEESLKFYKKYFATAKEPENENEREIYKYVKERIKGLKKH